MQMISKMELVKYLKAPAVANRLLISNEKHRI